MLCYWHTTKAIIIIIDIFIIIMHLNVGMPLFKHSLNSKTSGNRYNMCIIFFVNSIIKSLGLQIRMKNKDTHCLSFIYVV